MCGILFLLRKNGEKVSREELQRGQAAIHHRGPDSQETLVFDHIGVGFNRLSIVDMDEGNQPLWNEEKTVMVVCNGEIYNYRALRDELADKGHRFRSHSDCEVIPHLYEEDPADFMTRLDGMFAFVLIDFEKKRILVGRDRVGIKPMLVYEDENVLAAASEAKAMFATGAVPCTLDRQSLYDFFAFNYIPGQKTSFEGVRNVQPAHVLTYDFSGALEQEDEYWYPNFPQFDPGFQTAGPYAEALRTTFTESIASHTIGDLPVGAYLSGGLDSTVTTLLLRDEIGDKLRTYSIKFAGTVYDESEIIDETLRIGKMEGYAEFVDHITLAGFRQSVWAMEQPQMSPMDPPFCDLAKLVRSTGAKVVLCGEGSDELLGGYLCYTLNQINRALKAHQSAPCKPWLLDLALRYYGMGPDDRAHFSSVYRQDPAPITARFGTFPAWYPIWLKLAEDRRGLFVREWADSLGPDSEMARLADPLKYRYDDVDEFNKSLFLELKTRLPNYILHRADRLSMINSVEARVPYLSNEMIDLLCDVPPLLKMFGLREKHILRTAFADLIPEHVAKRRKFGYGAPDEFLWGAPEEGVRELMSEAALKESGIFDPARVAELLKQSDELPLGPERVGVRGLLTGVLSCQILHEKVQSGNFEVDPV